MDTEEVADQIPFKSSNENSHLTTPNQAGHSKEKWMEVLGCGVTEQVILRDNGQPDKVAWAFGLGLERLAMVLFDIPDIRLFWSSDKRFISQFVKGQMGIKFKPFSKYPKCDKDMTFWINDSFTEENLCEVVRGIAGDLAEEVQLIDKFTNKKGMTSHCYRITYRSMERSLTNDEINKLQVSFDFRSCSSFLP
ncbi:Phenylalanine--tRNA ligase, chloroplastic/mitochondrial [Linum grandiflorum]